MMCATWDDIAAEVDRQGGLARFEMRVFRDLKGRRRTRESLAYEIAAELDRLGLGWWHAEHLNSRNRPGDRMPIRQDRIVHVYRKTSPIGWMVEDARAQLDWRGQQAMRRLIELLRQVPAEAT